MAYVHHLVIHFPIAFAALAALLALYGLFSASTAWVRAASAVTYLTAVAAVVAAASGLLSAGHFVEGGGDAAAVAFHRNLALGATVVLAAAGAFSWNASRRDAGAKSRVAGVASILGAVAISGAGHFGGEMLHPGMAPWSNKAHSHGGASGAAEGSDGHAHGGPAASSSAAHDDDHDHAAAPASAASAPPAAGDAGARQDPDAARAASSATTPAPSAAPAPHTHKNDPHAH